jgi:ribosome-associated translation inhibitor RaiA
MLETEEENEVQSEAVEQLEPTEQDKEWEALCEEKQGQGDEVFDCFIQGQERAEAAKMKISEALDEFMTKMQSATERSVDQLVTPIYNVEREKIHGLEADCKKVLIQNHQKRNKFYKELDAAEKRISKDITALKARTLNIAEPENSPNKVSERTCVASFVSLLFSLVVGSYRTQCFYSLHQQTHPFAVRWLVHVGNG